MTGLTLEMGTIWVNNRQALPKARELLIQARAALPAPPSSQFSPHPRKENRGLETRLPPVAMIAVHLHQPQEVAKALGILAGDSGIRFPG